jgi:hypothetical protein
LDAAEGILVCKQDNAEEGRPLILRALSYMERVGANVQVASLRWTVAYTAYLSGNYEQCLAYASDPEPSLAAFRSRMDAYRENLLALTYCELDRLDESADLLRRCQANWRELGDLILADFCRLSLARISWKRGDLGLAWTEYAEVTAAFERWTERRGLSYAIEGLGRVAVDQGRFALGARLLGASQRVRESIGLRRDFADEGVYRKAVQGAREALGTAYQDEWRAGYSIVPSRAPQWVAQLGD